MSRLRKILKLLGFFLLIPALMALGFHLWLIAHAKGILAEVVQNQSNGRYTLQTKTMKYDYLRLRLELEKPRLVNIEPNPSGDKFELNANLITMQLEKLWPLISGRELLIDSIFIDHPDLNLIHQKKTNSSQQKTKFSLSIEMEKLYESIQSVLTTLKVSNFRLVNGSFTLNKASDRNSYPLEIKNIDFFINGFNIDSATVSQHPKSYTEDVQLSIAGQTIQFPDGDKAIRFSRFHFDAGNGNLEVDSCSIAGGENDSTKATFMLYAEKMRIKNIFVAGNDSSDYNRIDSLFFTKPKVSLSFQMKSERPDSSESIAITVRKITSAAFGRLLVRHMSINNVDFDIEVERKEKKSTFNFVQDTLVLSNLGIGLFPSMPLSASSIRFGVKEFIDYFRDSTYLVHFDSVRINNDQFSLFNTRVESTKRVKKGSQKISIPELQIKDIDWYQLITQKKLVASDITLQSPAISITGSGNSKSNGSKKNVNVEEQLKQALSLGKITVVNGSVNYIFPRNGYVNVAGVNTTIQPELYLDDLSSSLPGMVQHLNGTAVTYVKDGWRMIAKKLFYQKQNSLSAGSLEITNNQKNVVIQANNVDVEGFDNMESGNLLKLRRIQWKNAIINLKNLQSTVSTKPSLLDIGEISGGATEIKIDKDETHIRAKISKINTGAVQVENGKINKLVNLDLEGYYIGLTAGQNNFYSDRFSISDKNISSLALVKANFYPQQNHITLDVPAVQFNPDIQKLLNNDFNLHDIKLIQPKIDVTIAGTATSDQLPEQSMFPTVNISRINFEDPEIMLHLYKSAKVFSVDTRNSKLSVASIITTNGNTQLQMDSLLFETRKFAAGNDSLQINTSDGFAKLAVNQLFIHRKTKSTEAAWQLSGLSTDLSDISLLNKRRSGLADTIQLATLHSDHISLNDSSFTKVAEYFAMKPAFNLLNTSLTYKSSQSRLFVEGMKGTYDAIALDSFAYRPQASTDAFMKMQTYQKDYITVETGAAFLKTLDVALWLKDSIFRASEIHLTNATLNDTRDKHLPLETDVIKALPVTLLKNIPFRTYIDSITVNNSRVRYHEVSDKTNLTANIRFTRLEAILKNLKNYELAPADSLEVTASGYLMDSAFMRLRMKESYQDSLATFPLSVRVGPFDMKILNPFLLPAVSARIKSGVIDSFYLRALGSNQLAIGELLMFYHDLKVEFLKADSGQKKTILTSLKTFAANSFVIRTKNKRRMGKLYYERSPNRSFFNFLVRMAASGAASSVGARRSPKYNRLYNEKIRLVTLPPLINR